MHTVTARAAETVRLLTHARSGTGRRSKPAAPLPVASAVNPRASLAEAGRSINHWPGLLAPVREMICSRDWRLTPEEINKLVEVCSQAASHRGIMRLPGGAWTPMSPDAIGHVAPGYEINFCIPVWGDFASVTLTRQLDGQLTVALPLGI